MNIKLTESSSHDRGQENWENIALWQSRIEDLGISSWESNYSQLVSSVSQDIEYIDNLDGNQEELLDK